MNPGSKNIPLASNSIPPFFNLGLEEFLISMPGYPTLLTSVIIFFSTTISTGPFGGEPSPLIKVTPLIISCSYGPSPKYFSYEKLTNTNSNTSFLL